MSRQFTLPWLITFTSITAALVVVCLPYFLESTPLSSRFPIADGMFVRAEIIELSPTTKLLLRYSPIADEGVELEFMANRNRKWHAYMEPLGTSHSKYTHTVECFVYGNELKLRSIGSHGTIVEDRLMLTGELISRSVTPEDSALPVSQSDDRHSATNRATESDLDESWRTAP